MTKDELIQALIAAAEQGDKEAEAFLQMFAPWAGYLLA
jgi:nucleoid DNA-binding protein